MENNENSCNSLPYIDDVPTDDETNPHQYNLRIIENYHNKNRNIEITNRFPNEPGNSLSPVAPLADEAEFSDSKISGFAEEGVCKHARKFMSKESGMKLVIKGWNSSISIQGLDNKSSITFRRRCEKIQKNVERREERSKAVCDEAKSMEKSKKGRWKMLTRSIMMAKTARFDRRGLDERYPKYVLLKNEEEEVRNVQENYTKMFLFNDKSTKPKTKPEFSFKKSFKNKTEPIVPLEEILKKTDDNTNVKPVDGVKKQKKPLTARNLTFKKKIILEKRKSLTGGPIPQDTKHTGRPASHGQVYNEIQDVFEDTLKLLPQGTDTQQSEDVQQQPQRFEYYTSLPPQFCQFSCHDPYCCLPPHGHPPKYIPVYPSHKPHVYKHSNTQTSQEMTGEEQNPVEEADVDLENLPFGILSSFFPRVVIMNAIPNDEVEMANTANETELKNYQLPKTEGTKDLEEDVKTTESLEVPQQDLTLKSKMIREIVKPEPVIEEFFVGDVRMKEFPSFCEETRTKSQDSETTEYLQYTEFDAPGNEAFDRPNPVTPTPRSGSKEKEQKNLHPTAEKSKAEDDVDDENSENLSLTKIGYKMYDNLTKLSLNREKEITKMAEVSGCGCNGNGTKKSPYNITLESNNSVVKVTVPENELSFQIVNSEGGDIQIGVMRGARGEEGQKEKDEKNVVRKDELWHPDNGRRALVLRREKTKDDDNTNSKAVQKLKVSLADNKDVVLSIEMNEKEKKEEKPIEKSTKEMKVGTDDFDVAGGDFVCALGGNYRNLSPRLGQLLKHLHDKLENDKKERKFLDEKINQKLIDQKFQTAPLPGVFLVKHISPKPPAVKKPPEISLGKPKKETDVPTEGLREYYCEECLATMRIFEDENPSVKSMVDKFETIIQLESF